ncbi:HTH-type transcriptional activator RhaS [Rubripirellula obstinata]|uniref:HTH-type transcriptional activator RhaS n=1 Tax=Rubripirellula obstinata TaxID=406547 RepID=A0A5B1CMU4_9BACT|nr:AraC family transcriptional regulator [Rubripirellula obstinata]KAA1261109.1 HTH-type transcriptional activator RhaS [Rubripirellula obstinata]
MKMVYEKVVADEQASFRCLEWKDTDFDFPHHCHPEIEITQILASSGEVLIGDCFETYAAGDLTMFGPGLPHRYKNWKSGNAHSRVVQFHRDALGEGFFDLPECRSIGQLIQDSARGLRFSEAARKAGCRVMTRLFKAPTGLLRLSLLLELMDILGRDQQRRQMASHDFMAPKNIEQDERLQQVLTYIDAHWQETISLADASQVAGLHPQSLSRYFRQRLGKTFQQYVIELRLSRAARELLESERAVSEIAFNCGFNNLANFNRLFLARYKVAPRSYRSK